MFARAEAVHPGAQVILQGQGHETGGRPEQHPARAGTWRRAGHDPGKADVMLGYCSSSEPVVREISHLVSTPLPASLTVGPGYGLIVLSDQPLAAPSHHSWCSSRVRRSCGTWFGAIGLP